MREDLVPGNPFPDLRLPETTGDPLLVEHHITVPPGVP